MTDERYAFVEDVKNRKNVAKSSGKKGKSRYGCTLPSDYLSIKEKRDNNSRWISVTYDRPISYDKFLAYSDDDKKNYLQNLIDTYGGDTGKIAKMFGCTEAKIRAFRQDLGVQSANRAISNMSPPTLWETFLSLNEFLHKPMSVSDFKTLDWYDQTDYIHFLFEDMQIGLNNIASSLFGYTSGNSLRDYLDRNEIPYPKRGKAWKMTLENKVKFLKWLEVESELNAESIQEGTSMQDDFISNSVEPNKETLKNDESEPLIINEIPSMEFKMHINNQDQIIEMIAKLPKAAKGQIIFIWGND